MFLKNIGVGILIVAHATCYAQADVHFSQFYETSILRNPGLTGVFADDYKVSCFYRNQWLSVSVPYTTYLVSGETKVPVGNYVDDFVSFGMLLYRDKSGSAGQQITSIYPAVSYNKSLNPVYNSYLSFGICASYSQYSFDPGRITFNNQYQAGAINTSLPSLENIAGNSNGFWNLAAGLNFNTSNNEDNGIVYCLGVSGYNLTEQPISYINNRDVVLSVRANVNAAAIITVNEEARIQLHANYGQQGNFREIMGALLWTWSPSVSAVASDFSLTIGGIYRHNDVIAPTIKLRYQRLAISSSYDVNFSTFRPATELRGGFELSLSLSGNYPNNRNANRTILCPRF
jgi:type IX secretion system PorP/SprF family membrane protein